MVVGGIVFLVVLGLIALGMGGYLVGLYNLSLIHI